MSLTVDIHQHVIPDFYWQASNEDGNAAGGITPPRWSLDGAIAYLDGAGIDVAVPSISTPGVHFGDDAAARTLARQVNEYLAGIKHDRPDRFGGFAALPLPDVDGSLEQIAYALDVLELDGVSIFTNAGCWTIPSTRRGRSRSSTTATPLPVRPTSSTCSYTPAERSRSWPHALRSSMRWT
jgi:6-methylsalicylate decarboxylase